MTNSSISSVRNALISVSDKSGIVEFASGLKQLGVNLLSTGGTYKALVEAGLTVTEVKDYTGFPEMMAGRVKTLHPKVHGGILGRRGTDDAVMDEHGISPIDLVVVNLYPFVETVANPDCTLELAIENIDIGGPTMIRSAAKNHKDVGIVVDPNDYADVLSNIQSSQGLLEGTRQALALKAFEHTARYDAAIANYLGQQDNIRSGKDEQAVYSNTFNLQFHRRDILRYGENPHQSAAFYTEETPATGTVAAAKLIQGKALSFNNLADADSAFECVKSFTDSACVIVKHANPCGVATSTSQLESYNLAFATDPTSAFGGIIAFNQPLNAETASAIISRQFVEVIIAPDIASDALSILEKKPNVRVLTTGNYSLEQQPTLDYKRIQGGLLIQELDQGSVGVNDLTIVSKRQPSEEELADLLFAWKVAKFVRSNAIVYAKNQQTIGVGAGQMSRVYSAKIAGIKARDEGLEVSGSVMASDAFFPFRDGIDAAAKEGITAVIQPGGSIRDEEVIKAADEHGMTMVFTGMRHFRH